MRRKGGGSNPSSARVDEETREPDEREEGAKGHSLLLAKDGAEYLIDQSAAPIRDAKGEVAGVVLVFRDVTDITEKRSGPDGAREAGGCRAPFGKHCPRDS